MITIHVTQTHLDKGEEKNCYTCPVALAIQDIVKDDVLVEVDYNKVLLNKQIWTLPQIVKEHIESIDYGHYIVLPFSFELSLPECLLKCK